jgi:hypothetical protein
LFVAGKWAALSLAAMYLANNTAVGAPPTANVCTVVTPPALAVEKTRHGPPAALHWAKSTIS